MSGLGNAICALNKIGKVDQVFFIICAVIIAVIIAVYFLIPVFNKKLYKEQRENLKKREVAFKSNLQNNSQTAAAENVQEDTEASSVSSDE